MREFGDRATYPWEYRKDLLVKSRKRRRGDGGGEVGRGEKKQQSTNKTMWCFGCFFFLINFKNTGLGILIMMY